MLSHRIKFVLLTLFFAIQGSFLFSANLTVPLFELVTRGYLEDGIVLLNTKGNIGIKVEGGYKFGGSIVLGIESEELNESPGILEDDSSSSDIVNYLNTTPFLQFQSAEIVVRDIFGARFNLGYFTGKNDVFANGDIFRDRFGSTPVGSRVRGYVYFPEGIQYNGIFQVNGTGLKLESDFGNEELLAQLYTYQNSFMGRGYFTSLARLLINKPNLKFEGFGGASYPVHPGGMYHGGILLDYSPGDMGSFLTQVGIPRYLPGEDDFEIDLFYFLFEPKVKFSDNSLIFTLFWHPGFYGEYIFAETGELGSVDMNINFLMGQPEISQTSGGLEANASYATNEDEQFKARVSPYISFITDGVIWNMKVNTKVFPYELESMFEIFVGVRAEF